MGSPKPASTARRAVRTAWVVSSGQSCGVEQPLGRVVEHGDERLALPGTQGQPLMVAAVEVQQLADTGAGLAAPAVAAPGAPLGDEAGRLEGELDEGIGERHAVIPPGDVEEVADIEALVPRAVELQDPLDLRARRRAMGRAAGAAGRAAPGPDPAHTGPASAADCGDGCPRRRPP